jgi:hybrid cluster-associated redox disulfide protein
MAETSGTLPAPTISVASFLRETPAGARVFLAHRMACVGCSLAEFDTLADAAREYRLPLAAFLRELGRAARAAPSRHRRPAGSR